MGIENEGPRAASVGLMGMSVQLLLAGRGEVFSRIQEVGSTTHLLTFSCVLGTGLDAMVGKETPQSCVPDGGWGVACSSVESSCSFLYLDSIFVKHEDSFDRALVFLV